MPVVAKQLAQDTVQRVTRGRIIWRGPTDARRVAITFDDGPHAMTERYLACLGELGVPATFFVMGYFVERRPDVVADYVRGGHQLASHGYYHKRFTRTRPEELRDHLLRTDKMLAASPHRRW